MIKKAAKLNEAIKVLYQTIDIAGIDNSLPKIPVKPHVKIMAWSFR